MPEISVIVPVYKVEPYIHRCVDSILSQTFTDFELILVDDGSPDACGDICDAYAAKDTRIHVIHQENQGQAVARNHALDWAFEHSESEYISFIDSDDWVHPRYLELLREGIKQYNVNICQCQFVRTESESVQTDVLTEYSCISPERLYTEYYSAFLWDKLYDRSVWENVRLPEGQIFEDLAIMYRIIFSENSIAVLHATLYYYFFNQNSTVLSDWTPKRLSRLNAWEEQILYFERLGNCRVLREAIRRACGIVKHEYYAIQRSSHITDEEKEKYQNLIANRLRSLLSDYEEIIKSLPEYQWCWEIAHPILSRIIGRMNKLKRIITKR